MVEKVEGGYRIECDGKIQEEYVVPDDKFSGTKFGAELELFTLDRKTLEPKEMDIDSLDPEHVQGELAAEQIEIVSDPFESVLDLREQLYLILRGASNEAKKQDLMLVPISLLDYQPLSIRESPRYQILLDNLGLPFLQNAPYVASNQINIGARNEKEAFELFNAFRNVLPALVGMSASSPFRNAKASPRLAARMDIYDAAIGKFPDLTGLPPEINDLQEYAQHLEDLPIFQHPNMFYKYMRPMPQRGVAAEIRCIENQPSLERYLGFVALCKGLVNGYLKGDDVFPKVRHLDEAFLISRTYGNLIGNLDNLIETSARYLEPSERHLLDPLRTSCPAQQMLESYLKGRTVPLISKDMAQKFKAEIKR